MYQYSDEDIRNMKKITTKIAGDYLGISPMAVSMGMRNDKLPIGVAIQKNNNWSYFIVPERLIAYKYGNLEETLVSGIEDKLNKIIENFVEFKDILMTLLKDKQ